MDWRFTSLIGLCSLTSACYIREITEDLPCPCLDGYVCVSGVCRRPLNSDARGTDGSTLIDAFADGSADASLAMDGDVSIDSGLVIDAGSDGASLSDQGLSIDAFDRIDTFVASDAFTLPDAFALPDAFVPVDAFVPPDRGVDAGEPGLLTSYTGACASPGNVAASAVGSARVALAGRITVPRRGTLTHVEVSLFGSMDCDASIATRAYVWAQAAGTAPQMNPGADFTVIPAGIGATRTVRVPLFRTINVAPADQVFVALEAPNQTKLCTLTCGTAPDQAYLSLVLTTVSRGTFSWSPIGDAVRMAVIMQ